MERSRSAAYARTLSTLIQAQTVSAVGQTDLSKFTAFHVLLKKTFPCLFAAAAAEEFDGSLIIRWPGKDSAKNPVLLLSHHDVVEATGSWAHEPFSGDIADGKVWGRGTLDTKGNLWAMLQAADELAAGGFVPARDVYFESACNEETDGAGADAISRALQARGLHFFMTLDEGGMMMQSPIAGVDGPFAMVGVGEKGCADLKFIARSNGGHASTPGKNTPLVRLGKFMAAVEKSDIFESKMSDVVAEMFARMAPHMRGGMKLLCGNLWLTRGLLTKVLPSVSPAAGAMLKTTLAFTMSHGSEGFNVLPQEAWVVGNMRFSHHQGSKASIEAVTELAKKYDIETEILSPGFASPVADYRGEPFRLVEKAIHAVFPHTYVSPYIMTGASDSRFFGRVCDDCIRFAPFLISDQQMGSMHGLNENVDVETLAPAVDFFKFIMREI